MGRTDAEGREPRQLIRIGLVPCCVEQLEDAEGRASEGQCRRDGALRRKTGGVRPNRRRRSERPFRDLARRTEIGGGVDAPGRAQGESVLAALPEDRGRCSGDPGREPDDFHRGILLVERHRERFTCEL